MVGRFATAAPLGSLIYGRHHNPGFGASTTLSPMQDLLGRKGPPVTTKRVGMFPVQLSEGFPVAYPVTYPNNWLQVPGTFAGASGGFGNSEGKKVLVTLGVLVAVGLLASKK